MEVQSYKKSGIVTMSAIDFTRAITKKNEKMPFEWPLANYPTLLQHKLQSTGTREKHSLFQCSLFNFFRPPFISQAHE